jgi:hypothetical protein
MRAQWCAPLESCAAGFDGSKLIGVGVMLGAAAAPDGSKDSVTGARAVMALRFGGGGSALEDFVARAAAGATAFGAGLLT